MDANLPPERPTPALLPLERDSVRLVCIQADALCDAWPAIAAHVEQLPNAGSLMRDVGEGRATLWAFYAAADDQAFGVIGLAVVGVQDGAVCVRATAGDVLARQPDLLRLAICVEAHRVGCFRAACDIAPADAQRAHDLAMQRGAFSPPLRGDETNVGVH